MKDKKKRPNNSLFRAVFRLCGVMFLIVWGLLPILFGRLFSQKDIWWAAKKRQRIAQNLIRFLNIHLIQTGKITVGNYLYVGNHRSYLDPIAVACFIPFVPIAKAEVARWPIIGWGIRLSGVFFVKRESRDSRIQARQSLKHALLRGWGVLVYPEGTTAAVGMTLPFRPGTFAVAADVQKPIVPIAIEYDQVKAAFVGRDTFMSHFIKCFSTPNLTIKIHFFDPIEPFGQPPEVLQHQAKMSIDSWLATPSV